MDSAPQRLTPSGASGGWQLAWSVVLAAEEIGGTLPCDHGMALRSHLDGVHIVNLWGEADVVKRRPWTDGVGGAVRSAQ